MKSKQLANVLIKILGLSVCLQAIPGFVSGFLRGLFSPSQASSVAADGWMYAVGSGVYMAVGIFLLVRSRYVVEKLFRGEDE
jgi:hypothetical protein